MHFVADVHHFIKFYDDKGGNDCKVSYFSKYRKTNLHKIWDTLIIEHERLSYTEYANFLDTHDNHVIKSLQDSDIDWVYESAKAQLDLYPVFKVRTE